MPCKMDGCARIYHFPCGTASGAFQEVTTLTMYCSQHLAHVPLACEGIIIDLNYKKFTLIPFYFRICLLYL